MGRYNFAAQKVHQHATQLLHLNRIPTPPPWYAPIGATPPSQRLVRPPLQRPQKSGKRASRMFQPVKLQYEEDQLRWEYFNDHPWELARPRVILENDGKDLLKWDWSLPLDYSLNRPKVGEFDEFGRSCDDWDRIQATQSMRPINGEAVVQRQLYLHEYTDLSPPAAYDRARKELYRYRHAQEVEVRVAREEAMSQGAYFGLGPLEVGKVAEDRAYRDFREWAKNQTQLLQQRASTDMASDEREEEGGEAGNGARSDLLQDPEQAVSASRAGQTAEGSVAFHP